MIRSHALLTLAAAWLALPAALAGQDTTQAHAPKAFCFSGAPRAKCRTFVIAEMQGSAPLFQSMRTVSWTPDEEPEQLGFFDERLEWEVGLMRNVSDRWALGGSVRLASADGGALQALTARARRWMSDEVAVDLSAGAHFIERIYPEPRQAELTADARLNFRDKAYVGLRYDQATVVPSTNDWGGFDEGGDQRALSLLAGVGSDWALGGSAAAGLGLILLAGLVSFR
jgi:hypothetical protein